MQTILLADDSKNIREYCRAALEDDGYRVVLAQDGVEALAVFCEKLPDLVILDIGMPRMNGLETLDRIMVVAPGAPVILFTAQDEGCLQDRRGRLACACLEKDEDLSELKLAIRRILATTPVERQMASWRLGLPPDCAQASREAETEVNAI